MTETFTEPPQLPARRFPISRKSAEHNRWIFVHQIPVMLLLSAYSMGIPIAMNPSSQATIYYFVFFIPFLFMMFFLLRTVWAQLDQTSYAVDSGFLITFVCGRRSWIRIDLSKITRAVVGNVEHPDEMRMQLTTRRGWVLDIPATEDMEEFTEAVAYYLPVEFERRSEALAIWTKQTVASIALSLIFLVVFFTSLSYMIV